jgi:GntR family transcriptional regulator
VQLRRRTAEPIGDQIRRIILGEITSGAWTEGEQLPTERELAERFGVSLAPLRSALNDLTKAGVIERIQGKGTFVRDAMIPIRLGVLPSFTDSIRSLGLPFAVRLLDFGPARPPADVAKLWALRRPAGEAFRIRRLVAIRDIPAACLDAWFFPASFGASLTRAELEQGASIYRLAKERMGCAFESTSGTITIETTMEDILGLLDLPFGSPIAKVVMLSTDRQKRIHEHSTLYCDAKRFTFHIQS